MSMSGISVPSVGMNCTSWKCEKRVAIARKHAGQSSFEDHQVDEGRCQCILLEDAIDSSRLLAISRICSLSEF